MKTIIVWFRNDLRLHDHVALAEAVRHADAIVPLFIFDKHLLFGRHASSNRNRFLLECVADLRATLKKHGSNLVVRTGEPATVLSAVARECQARAVYYTADYSPYARQRDGALHAVLQKQQVVLRSFAGRLICDDLEAISTKTQTPFKVFTPFWKAWSQLPRRQIVALPQKLRIPAVKPGALPALANLTQKAELAAHALPGGETEARTRLRVFLRHNITEYNQLHNDLGADKTSRLSPYVHFGCISPLEIETLLPDTQGATAWHRQLAWRDFYHYILYHFPDNAQHEFQPKYRHLKWLHDNSLLQAWQRGKTGYPIVDAAMRQLQCEGWMHNRARLIVGSFLTKDLGLDWRHGETHFMRYLLDGDEANNNGNWQWIASVGVDPAPLYRRLYNPVSQAKSYDVDGHYVRRYVPELSHVPTKYIFEPWTMPTDIQRRATCVIGKDYPARIVDHATARQMAFKRYQQA